MIRTFVCNQKKGVAVKLINYTDLGNTKPGRNYVRPLQFFFMRSLLHSRVDSGVPVPTAAAAEMVNVYLVEMLSRWALVSSLQLPERPPDSLEFYQLLQGAVNDRQRGDLWRSRADNHLLTEGVFTGSSEQQRANRNQLPVISGAAQTGGELKGQYCYRAAACHYRQSSLSHSGLIDTLEFLDQWYPEYIQVLRYLTVEYLSLLSTLTPSDLAWLQADISLERFLDALSLWATDRSDANAQTVWDISREARVPREKLPPDLLQQLSLTAG